MTENSHKLWFSLLHKRPYSVVEPNYPVVSNLKGIAELEKNHAIILVELENYLKQFVIMSVLKRGPFLVLNYANIRPIFFTIIIIILNNPSTVEPHN